MRRKGIGSPEDAGVFLRRKGLRFRKKPEEKPQRAEGNPYLPWIREIIEQILTERKIGYDEFLPVLIDGKDSKECLSVAEALSEGLNHLVILTERPAYFESYADNMYEEHGLIAEICLKDHRKIEELETGDSRGNVIIDFEEQEERKEAIRFGKKLYIPVFKKQWEHCGNLDIAVPIGYNTVIVRSGKIMKKQPGYDKFERAFYENK